MNKIWYQNHPLKYLLLPITLVFYCLVHIRYFLYQNNILTKKISQTPVVIIGNISVGGTGKTPFIIYLANQLQKANINVAIVSRGYGRKGTQNIALIDSTFLNSPLNSPLNSKGSTLEHGDEPVLIATKTGAPVVVATNRADACAFVDKHCNADVILSDDGMQHYAMARAKEWCLVDEKRGFGNFWLLPAGPLREPMKRLKTVDEIILNSTNITLASKQAFSLNINQAYLLNDTSQTKPLRAFAKQHCIAMAGIAHPQRFFNALAKQGIKTNNYTFADHYAYQPSDFESVGQSKIIFITEKDAIKCNEFDLPHVWVVPANVMVSQKLEQTINNLIADIQQKRLANG